MGQPKEKKMHGWRSLDNVSKAEQRAGNPERAVPSSVAGQRAPSDEMGWKGGRLYLWSVYSGPIQMSFCYGGSFSLYIGESYLIQKREWSKYREDTLSFSVRDLYMIKLELSF